MLQKQRDALEAANIYCNAANPEIHFGVGKACQITIEEGAELRAGRYDISRLGAFSYIGGGATIARNISSIGRFCSIAPNLVSGPVEHPVDYLSPHCLFQGRYHAQHPEVSSYLERNKAQISRSRAEYDRRYADTNTKIHIGHDVWIGEGVFIRRGVSIGHGAVIASRSVVNKDVAPYTIVGGIPAKPIKKRFDDRTIELLLEAKWWEYGLAALDGVDLLDPASSAKIILKNIENNNLSIWKPASRTVRLDGTVDEEDL